MTQTHPHADADRRGPYPLNGSSLAGAVFGGAPTSPALDRAIRRACHPTFGSGFLTTRDGTSTPACFATTAANGRRVGLVNLSFHADLSGTVQIEGPGAYPRFYLNGSLTSAGFTLEADAQAWASSPVQQLLHTPTAVAALLLGGIVDATDAQHRPTLGAILTHRDRVTPRQSGPKSDDHIVGVPRARATMWHFATTLTLALHTHDLPLAAALRAIYLEPVERTRAVALSILKVGFTGSNDDLLHAARSALQP